MCTWAVRGVLYPYFKFGAYLFWTIEVLGPFGIGALSFGGFWGVPKIKATERSKHPDVKTAERRSFERSGMDTLCYASDLH